VEGALKPSPILPLVYIYSAAHSGSTLLAMQLAKHPEIATVGELSGTPYRARPGYKCSCGRELQECGFWHEVSAAMARRGFSYSATTAETDIRNASNPFARRLLKPMHRGPLLELARDVGMLLAPGCRFHIRHHQNLKAALVESIVECTGKPWVIDSSKSGVQLKYHLRNPRLDVKVIWLVRDGRGVALSIRRNQGASLPHAAYHWRRRNEEAGAVVGRLDPSRWTQVRYEALCAEPQRTLERLWQFIGVAPSINGHAAPQYHVLGHISRLNGAASIQLNEKWRTELSADDLRTFEVVAGPLNRKLGYR
jgi:hypothetical protein